MAWLRIDDRVRTHPKIVKAGPAAAWLWFCGVCYCREHLTDGFIQSGMVPTLAPGLTAVKKHVAALVNVGLWHSEQGGYRVHDFLDWNPSRAQVEEQRAQDRQRKRGGVVAESSEIPDGIQTSSSCASAGDAGLGSGSSSADVALKPEESKSFTAPVRRGFGGGAGAGTFPRDHLRHAWCGERICVPDVLHVEFQRRIGGDAADADRQLRALYQRVHSAIPAGPFGDETFAFWKGHVFAAFPQIAPKTQQKAGLVDKMRASDIAAKAEIELRGTR